jgi:hypothetical protein
MQEMSVPSLIGIGQMFILKDTNVKIVSPLVSHLDPQGP